MILKATKFRQNLYRFLDSVLDTGIPIEIERRGKILKIVPVEKKNKLDNLERLDVTLGNTEDLANIEWSDEWQGYDL